MVLQYMSGISRKDRATNDYNKWSLRVADIKDEMRGY